MTEAIRKRLAKLARRHRAIQYLALSQLRSRHNERLAEYEEAVTGIVKALTRINQDTIWSETAAALAKARSAQGHTAPLTPSLIRNAIQCRTVLQNDLHDCLVATLQAEIDAAFKDAIAADRHVLLSTRLGRWPCSKVVKVSEDGRSAVLDSRKLYLLAVNDFIAAAGITLEIGLDREIDQVTFDDWLQTTTDLRTFALIAVALITMKSGSVHLLIRLSPEDADKLQHAFREGNLRTLGGMPVESLKRAGEWAEVTELAEESFAVMLDPRQPLTEADKQRLAAFLDREKERAREMAAGLGEKPRGVLPRIAGWLSRLKRRPQISAGERVAVAAVLAGSTLCRSVLDLLFILFPKLLGSADSQEGLRESASRWLMNWRSTVNRAALVEDSLNAFVIWPMVTAVCVAVLLSILGRASLPVVLWAAASGAALAMAGGVVCASVLSIRACGAAGVLIGTAFGVVHGLIAVHAGGLGGLANLTTHADVLTRTIGGFAGVAAPQLLGRGWPWSILALGVPALGIASAARMMARPFEAAGEARLGPLRELQGMVLGSLAGSGIFLVMAGTRLLSGFMGMEPAFVVAYACLSLIVLLCLFRLRAASMPLAALLALSYLMAGLLLLGAQWWSPVSWPALLAGSAATAMFQAQFFTLAWLIGYRVGGWRAAVLAACLEGVGGYIGFVLSRVF